MPLEPHWTALAEVGYSGLHLRVAVAPQGHSSVLRKSAPAGRPLRGKNATM